MKRKSVCILIVLLTVMVIGLFYINASYARTLYWGTRGADVREVQSKLKRWGYYRGAVDGIFGAQTYRAVVYFQRKNGLTPDGVVGRATKAALGISTARRTTATYNRTVELAQRKLSQWGYYNGPIDGIYGPKTYSAVIKFQRKNGLKVDGYIGPETRRALGISTAAVSRVYKSSSTGVSKSDDVTLLAMIINGEARGEPYVGQVAVGAVILNRVKHPSFPNTIAGVIYQPLAFEAVSNGQIYARIEPTAYKAARDALNGWDPTGGALYYWNPATATSNWVWQLKPTLKIGKHIFAKK